VTFGHNLGHSAGARPWAPDCPIPKGKGQFLWLSSTSKSTLSCCGVRSKKSITVTARLLQPTAMLPTVRRHINFSRVKNPPPVTVWILYQPVFILSTQPNWPINNNHCKNLLVQVTLCFMFAVRHLSWKYVTFYATSTNVFLNLLLTFNVYRIFFDSYFNVFTSSLRWKVREQTCKQ